jgi:hypothetical protein
MDRLNVAIFIFHVVDKLCGQAIANETAHYIDYPRHAA